MLRVRKMPQSVENPGFPPARPCFFEPASARTLVAYLKVLIGIMSDSPAPVFVFGALRSGTTLLRLMLKHHSGIHSPGEADFLFDHVMPAGDGWAYDRTALEADRIFRDKETPLRAGLDGQPLARALHEDLAATGTGIMSLNIHRNAEKMQALFPDARIIHLLRDPRDVSRSSIGMGWAGNSFFGVDHWIDTEAGWDRASYPESQVLTVHFEELMADLEPQLTRICDFLGLAFEPDMLRYYENSTYDPPDPKIAQKWKKKAGSREIALLEGRVGALLARRGYEPSGAPALPGAFELMRLKLESRWKRWRFNADRYGVGLFLGHHLARTLGLKGLERKLAARQEAIRVEGLQ